MIIISLLGLSANPDKKSFYDNHTDYDIQPGKYINSTDALLHSFGNNVEKYIFFGTNEAIEKHKKVLSGDQVEIEWVEYENGNLNNIFSLIVSTVLKYKGKSLLFDITHSFRDAVIMSVLSVIISQIVHGSHTTLIYAKQIVQYERYTYELVGEDIINTSNIAFMLNSFIETLKVPPLQSKYELYETLDRFSVHLLSNQIIPIYQQDVPKLKRYISQNKEKLFFVRDSLNALEKILLEIEKSGEKTQDEKLLFFADFFYQKDYYLHAATYLIEGLTQHVAHALREQKYITFETDEYKNQQKIVTLLNSGIQTTAEDFSFPDEYFVDVNIRVFQTISAMRDGIGKIRNNLAHIGIDVDFENIKDDLGKLIRQVQEVVATKMLYHFEKVTEENKRLTPRYQLNQHRNEIKRYTVSGSSIKIETAIKKYQSNTLEELTNMDVKRLKAYLDKHHQEITGLLDAVKPKSGKKDRI